MTGPLPYCVYVLRSDRDHEFYVGFTTDLTQRLAAHNDGSVPSTAARRPLQLVFCEYYRSKADALHREQYLKTSSGKRALRLMLTDT
jgi:putative endonuclease